MADEWRETAYGPINADFAENRLADLCCLVNGIQTGPFGTQLHKKDYVPVGTPIITVEHLGENRILHEGVPCVSEKDRLRLSKYWLRKGDIVFSRVGSVDRRALVRDGEDGWLFSGRCLRVRPNSNHIDAAFLSYFFGLSTFKEHIRSIAVGATMPSLNTKILSDISVPHPESLVEQRSIAHILGTLDDKIELNRQMNQTLEEMARALFKSWFVDFDPVHAKATLKHHAGNPFRSKERDRSVERARAYLDRMDPNIAALFPDRFVDSELGPIPEGWGVRALGECFEVERGLAYKGSALSSFGVPMHNLNSVFEGGGYKNDGIKYYSGDYRPRHVVKPGDVIVSNTEQGHDRLLIGFAAIVPKCFGDYGLFSHHIYGVRTKGSFVFASDFVCRLLNTQAIHDTVSGYATGTTVNMLPVDALRIPRFVAPPAQVETTFGTIAEKARVRQEASIAESRTLAALRDTLLPKLVSGELRVGISPRVSDGQI